MQDSNIDTILGSDIIFRGKLSFKKNLKINGSFTGKIDTAGHLIIGNTAKVEADINAGTVSVEGNVRGNVNAIKNIDIMKSARLTGDLRTPDLQIQSGSHFSGNCIMD